MQLGTSFRDIVRRKSLFQNQDKIVCILSRYWENQVLMNTNLSHSSLRPIFAWDNNKNNNNCNNNKNNNINNNNK